MLSQKNVEFRRIKLGEFKTDQIDPKSLKK